MASFHEGSIWSSITAAASASSEPAHVAVAYFGQRGPALLPLRPDSHLIVDLSPRVVAGGAVDPRALEILRAQGVRIFGLANLHAKVFVFDTIGFVGSTNASRNSERALIEAALSTRVPNELSLLRSFVLRHSLNQMTKGDLARLAKIYRPPAKSDYLDLPESFVISPAATLFMELTLEQGRSRITQVQPPKPIWERFFNIPVSSRSSQSIRLLSLHNRGAGYQNKPVVYHDHTYTVEIPEAHLPRPAIMKIKRTGKNKFDYSVLRPPTAAYTDALALLRTTYNPFYTTGRRWAIT